MSDTSTREAVKTTTDESKALRCRACGLPITTESCRVERDGKTVHTFLNRAGFMYTIGCFSRAPGGRKLGDYTFDFSWFEGYAWCFLVCGGCQSHLGWHFSGNEGTDFHGLILDRLTADA